MKSKSLIETKLDSMKPINFKSKRSQNRIRMRASNKMVRETLLEKGFDEIWFKAHTNRSDRVFTQRGVYLATDLWNLFDGMAFSMGGVLWFLQMKTNVWAKEKPLQDFAKRHKAHILSFNVTNKLKECKGKWKVFSRCYE